MKKRLRRNENSFHPIELVFEEIKSNQTTPPIKYSTTKSQKKKSQKPKSLFPSHFPTPSIIGESLSTVTQ